MTYVIRVVVRAANTCFTAFGLDRLVTGGGRDEPVYMLRRFVTCPSDSLQNLRGVLWRSACVTKRRAYFLLFPVLTVVLPVLFLDNGVQAILPLLVDLTVITALLHDMPVDVSTIADNDHIHCCHLACLY
jgi:hypothetical protein